MDIRQINVNPWLIYYKVENDSMRRNLEEILYQKIFEEKIK